MTNAQQDEGIAEKDIEDFVNDERHEPIVFISDDEFNAYMDEDDAADAEEDDL